MRFAFSSALLLTCLCLSACGGGTQETQPPPTPVGTAAAFEGPAVPTIRTNGVLANKDETRLSFKVGGVIERIAVSEGQRVRAGQTLAQIERIEINAQVEQARQARDKAQRDVERGARLYADQVISLEQLQDLKTQAAVAQAALQAAEFNASYAAIVAPSDGTVLRQLAEERELVAAGAPILVLGLQETGFVVRAGLADREIVQVKTGDTAEVALDALPGEVLVGSVSEVASAADPATGLFSVEVSIDAKGLPLKSGLVAKLNITPAAAHAARRVYVPIGSIVEGDGNRASVFVLADELAKRREVEIAFIEQDRVALLSGVQAGEQVVTDGSLYLEDGERVSVQQAVAHTDPSIPER